MPHRRALALLFLAALATGMSLMLAGPAAADVTGPCTATMNGADVNTIDTPATALEVPFDGTVTVEVESSGAVTSHSVKLEPIGGVGFTASEGTDDGNRWSGTVHVADYAKYGVGIYKVTGTSNGPGACSGTAFVKITGKSPLTTAAGAAGAALTVVGAIGLGATAIRMRGKVRHDKLGAWTLPLTLGMAIATMVSGAGAPGAGAVRSRPRLSVSALFWSLLAGLGTLVLCQQYAVFYPTTILATLWLLAWVLIGGVLIPSLAGAGVRSARPAAVASATPTAAPAWAPTHRTPAGGLDAWTAPDPASGQPTRLDPGLALRVEQTTGDWAKVTASNGWTGWVDGRHLEALA